MRKIHIDKSNHLRALLTDTLPYEIPLFFTNEPLYLALTKSQDLSGLPTFVRSLVLSASPTKPFSYRVQKGGGSHRNLALPHPAAQIKFAELYRDFDSFIENICARSTYSLRYPTRVGSHFYQSQFAADQPHSGASDDDPASFSTQRKWASSYFYYKHYNHIHKFFASPEFIRLEQKFSMMLKIDISRCFESIYTHSISWAIRGKEFGKDNKNSYFFESEFDTVMQRSNWGETSGILIGPEISRIFAEAIMQSIDLGIQRRLDNLTERVSVRRYVDDFFIFGNSEDDLLKVKTAVEEVASSYNLHINEKKTAIVSRPLASSLSVARQRVAKLLKDVLRQARNSLIDGTETESFSRHTAEKTISDIRRIARENDVDYATLASPALAIIARGAYAIRQRMGPAPSPSVVHATDRVNLAMLKIATFLFLMDIRAATSHKLAKVFLECSVLNERLSSGRAAFEGAVLDTVRLALEQARLRQITGPEVINVLVAADAICNVTKVVSEEFLRSAMGVEDSWNKDAEKLNYFDLVSVLYFSRTKHSFNHVRSVATAEIRRRVLALGSRLNTHTEETLLFFDFLSCPYIPRMEREALYKEVANAHGVTANQTTLDTQFQAISRSIFFVAWEGANRFQALLERRELQPAYDS